MKPISHAIVVSLVVLLTSILLTGTMSAQNSKFRNSAMRYGVHLGLNYNSASLGYQNLHEPFPNFDKPNSETDENINGTGWGGYGGAIIEYLSSSWWGLQLRVSYDMRDATVKDIYATPNTEFITRMNYMSFEPALRIDQHLIPGLSFTAGGLIAANIHGRYDFKADANGPITDEDIKVPDRSVASLGVTGGVAYDIEIARGTNTSTYLTPFVDYSWIAAQRKSVITEVQNSSNDIWSTQTFRFGLRLSWESRSANDERVTMAPPPRPPERTVVAVAKAPDKMLVMVLPTNGTIRTEKINGYFPILPYVFFDKGNNEIPSRYVLLSKNDAKNFRESDMGDFQKGDFTTKETNIDCLMLAHRNVMNIYADRMRTNTSEKLVLRGCDPEEKSGEACAKNVKNYLVNTYGIDPARITIIVEPPSKPSGSIYTDPAFTDLIDDENRRVSLRFTNEDMYKPVAYTIRDESSISNDISFTVMNAVPFKSWSVTVAGEGNIMHFGPFVTRNGRINPAPLMRGRDRGDFTANVEVVMRDGRRVNESMDFSLARDNTVRNASRYLMVFDYNKSEAVKSYETKIRKEITPGMSVGNTVIIHGHTDIIGNEEGNQKLSQERADEAKRVVDDELGKERKVVNVTAIGVGQTNMQYTFENTSPEGRMYNRNVFVEIIR